MDWTLVAQLLLGLLILGGIFVAADRLTAMARRRGHRFSTRALVAVVALVGGPVAWLGLWWLLREVPPAAA